MRTQRGDRTQFWFAECSFYLFAKDFHALSIVTWWALKTFSFFHVHPEASRPLDVDRTRLLFNSAKIRLDISLNYTSKGTCHKSTDIGAFLDIDTAAAAIRPLPNIWQLDLGLPLSLQLVYMYCSKLWFLKFAAFGWGHLTLSYICLSAILLVKTKRKKMLVVNNMTFPIKCNIGGNPGL